MYENGKGVSRNPEKPIRLCETAAITVPTAGHNLALMYFQGDPVRKDSVLAYNWELVAVSGELKRRLDEGAPSRAKDKLKVPGPRVMHAVIQVEEISRGMSKDEKKAGRRLAEK